MQFSVTGNEVEIGAACRHRDTQSTTCLAEPANSAPEENILFSRGGDACGRERAQPKPAYVHVPAMIEANQPRPAFVMTPDHDAQHVRWHRSEQDGRRTPNRPEQA